MKWLKSLKSRSVLSTKLKFWVKLKVSILMKILGTICGPCHLINSDTVFIFSSCQKLDQPYLTPETCRFRFLINIFSLSRRSCRPKTTPFMKRLLTTAPRSWLAGTVVLSWKMPIIKLMKTWFLVFKTHRFPYSLRGTFTVCLEQICAILESSRILVSPIKSGWVRSFSETILWGLISKRISYKLDSKRKIVARRCPYKIQIFTGVAQTSRQFVIINIFLRKETEA